MKLPKVRLTVRRVMLLVAILAVGFGGYGEVARRRRRDREIQRVLVDFESAPGWWPEDWKRELQTSLTIEGDASLDGTPVNDGMVTFREQPGDRIFRVPIRRGRYSMLDRRMPVGSYRITVESFDGPEPRSKTSVWAMGLDAGRHRSNWHFGQKNKPKL